MRSNKLILFVTVFVDILGFGILIPMLPFIARSFSASAFEVGLLMSIYSGIQIFVAPIWGSLSDRWGRRPILLLTIFGQALAFLWAAYAPTYFELLLSRAFAGFFAANISTAQAYMADISKPEDRARSMGLLGAAFGLGFIFGPAMGGLLIQFGIEWPPLASAILGFANFAWAFVALGEPIRQSRQREMNRESRSLIRLLDLGKVPHLWVPVTSFFLMTYAFVQLEITFGYLALDRFQLSERNVGLILAAMGLISAAIQGGLIGRIVKVLREGRVIFLGATLAIAGYILLSVSFVMGGMIVSLLLLASAYSMTNPCLSSVSSKLAPDGKTGEVLGIYHAGGSLARVLAPISAGLLYDRANYLPYVTAAFLALLTATFWIKKRSQAF